LDRAARCPAAEKKFSVNIAVSTQVLATSPSSTRMPVAPGFVSANLHVSFERTNVVNNAQF